MYWYRNPYWYWQQSLVGQALPALPSGLLRKQLPPSPTPSPQIPPSVTPPDSPSAGLAIVRTPLGLDVYMEPRRNALLAFPRYASGTSHLFNNDSVIVYETDIVEFGLPETSRARWWRISKEVSPGVVLSGFVRALDESGGYKLEPLNVLPGRNVTQSLSPIRRRF